MNYLYLTHHRLKKNNKITHIYSDSVVIMSNEAHRSTKKKAGNTTTECSNLGKEAQEKKI